MNITLITREKGHLPKPVTMSSTSGRIKILALGDAFVGKSTLIKAYCEGKFISDYIPTIGIDYGVRTSNIEDIDVKINFWDVAGDPIYFEVRNEFYKDTHGIMLVFDVTNRRSFENLIQWIAEINRFLNKDGVVIHLVGNKLDREPRIISFEEATRFATKNNFKYTEISAKSIEAVHKLFENLFLDIISTYKNRSREHEQSQDQGQVLNHSHSQVQTKENNNEENISTSNNEIIVNSTERITTASQENNSINNSISDYDMQLTNMLHKSIQEIAEEINENEQ